MCLDGVSLFGACSCDAAAMPAAATTSTETTMSSSPPRLVLLSPGLMHINANKRKCATDADGDDANGDVDD